MVDEEEQEVEEQEEQEEEEEEEQEVMSRYKAPPQSSSEQLGSGRLTLWVLCAHPVGAVRQREALYVRLN